ncbi:hypothetical protein NQ318_011886 [Aromia moschata]|uniref:Uncharacterized protein n=1 Tax=Aromia moschata TaxID=1265417 RepID=A0AAV8XWR7_9CUCU|nr:hypothetical protein NQ318_011886 [Aromia moschata]
MKYLCIDQIKSQPDLRRLAGSHQFNETPEVDHKANKRKVSTFAAKIIKHFHYFTETHPDLPPLNQGTISKIEAQYREMGHVRKVPSKRQAVVDDDTKLNLLLSLEENPITPARQLARDRPFFFDDTLNGPRYLRLLQHELMPVLCHLFPNPLNPNLTDERLWFQQDGAPPHYAVIGLLLAPEFMSIIMSRVVSATPEELYFSYYLQNVDSVLL